MSLPRLLTLLAAAAIASVVIAACGGDDDGGGDEDPKAVLDAAFQNATGVTSGVLDLDLSATSESEEESSLEIQASGPFQESEQDLPSFDIETSVSSTGGPVGDINFDASLSADGKSAFVEYSGSAYEVPSEYFELPQSLFTGFTRLLTLQADGEGGAGCREALLAKGLDTSSFLGELSNEGTEEIDGVETIHVSGELDLDQVSENVASILESPECEQSFGGGRQLTAEQIDQLTEQIAASAEPITDSGLDFYVGADDDLLRGFDVRLDSEQDAEAASFDVEVRLSDVNQPQEIEAPADAQPISKLLDQLGLGGALEQLGVGGSGGGSGASALPEAGGPPAGPGDDETADYLECLSTAEGDEATQECAQLLQ